MTGKHPYWRLPLKQGELLLTPCPGTQDSSLPEALRQLKIAGATTLITLMTDAELEANGAADIREQSESLGLSWLHFPIEDEAVPDASFEPAWLEELPQLEQQLAEGGAVAIHCKGGSGRTGLMAARFMLAAGEPLEESVKAIQSLRPRAFFFQQQRDYIKVFATARE